MLDTTAKRLSSVHLYSRGLIATANDYFCSYSQPQSHTTTFFQIDRNKVYKNTERVKWTSSSIILQQQSILGGLILAESILEDPQKRPGYFKKI